MVIEIILVRNPASNQLSCVYKPVIRSVAVLLQEVILYELRDLQCNLVSLR